MFQVVNSIVLYAFALSFFRCVFGAENAVIDSNLPAVRSDFVNANIKNCTDNGLSNSQPNECQLKSRRKR